MVREAKARIYGVFNVPSPLPLPGKWGAGRSLYLSRKVGHSSMPEEFHDDIESQQGRFSEYISRLERNCLYSYIAFRMMNCVCFDVIKGGKGSVLFGYTH